MNTLKLLFCVSFGGYMQPFLLGLLVYYDKSYWVDKLLDTAKEFSKELVLIYTLTKYTYEFQLPNILYHMWYQFAIFLI